MQELGMISESTSEEKLVTSNDLDDVESDDDIKEIKERSLSVRMSGEEGSED